MNRLPAALLLLVVLHAYAQTTPSPFAQVQALVSERYISPVGKDIAAWLESTRSRFERECALECPKSKSIPLLRDALAELDDPHAFLTWPLPLEGSEARPLGSPLQENTYDFNAVISPNVVVTHVQPDGVSDRAGLRVGDVIGQLNDQVLPPDRLFVELGRAEAAGQTIRVTVLRGQTKQTLRLSTRSGITFLPPKVLDARTGPVVLVIPHFGGLGIADRAVHDAVAEITGLGTTQLIIDLRRSTGGTPYATANAAGAFVERTAWVVRDKANRTSFHSFARGQIVDQSPNTQGMKVESAFRNPSFFTGRVCVLVGSHTFSSGENFVLLLQRSSRAHVVGDRTFGGAGVVNNFFDLILGPSLSLTTHLMFFDDGTRVPSRVTPDQIVKLDVEGLTRGRDNQLEACKTWLRSAGN